MTYFYAQLFAMDTEIRAMLRAAMDVQLAQTLLSRGPAGRPHTLRQAGTQVPSVTV